MSRPARALALAALLALGALGVAAYVLLGGSDTETLETPEFSFDYPSEWERIEGVQFPLAEAAAQQEVGKNTVGLDPDNWVTAYGGQGGVEINAQNIDQLLTLATPFYRKTFEEAGGRMLQDPYRVRAAGLPAIRFRVAVKSVRGVAVEDEVTTLYRGRRIYTVNCQNRPERATEITAGCAQEGRPSSSRRGAG
jgi:hypothetical protein